MVLEQGTHAKVKYSSYVLSRYCRFTGQGSQVRRNNNRLFKGFRFSSTCWLHKKIVATGVDLRVVVWVKEFLLEHLQRVRIDWQLSEEVRVTSGVLQGSVLGHLLFLANVNDILRNIKSNIQLFIGDCIIYRKIMDSSDIDKLHTYLTRLKEWAVGNEMKNSTGKIKQ